MRAVSARGVRFEAPDARTLERIADGPLPGALRGEPAGVELFRDVYYDTPERDLRRRGVAVRVRFHDGGGLGLAVEARGDDEGEGRLEEAETTETEVERLFAGRSDAARLLRAAIDPDRLERWIEVETLRRTRRVWVAAPEEDEEEAWLVCDARTVRDGGLSALLADLEVRGPDDPDTASLLARLLEEEFRLRRLGAGGDLARALRSLEESEVDWLEEAVRSARRVAVVGWRDGRVALFREPGRLRVASGQGSGEEACRRVLRTVFGAPAARVRLLGTGPGTPNHPATEVWLADGVDDPGGEPREGLVHLPLDELLASVGSPALRDDATLAALHVLARSDLPSIPPREPPAVPPVEGAAYPPPAFPPPATYADRAEAEARRTLLAPLPPEAALDGQLPAGTLLNMELSLLAFNRRVLALAEDERVPLLERVRFLSIFGANLDEFFRVRVAGFKRQAAAGSTKRTMDGVTPREQLDAIGARARTLSDRAYRLLFDALLPALDERGIRLARPADLKRREREALGEFYEAQVHPLLTPLVAGPGRPFPHIRNQRPSVLAVLRPPRGGAESLGVVELPDGLPRFVPLGDGRFVALEAVILERLERLFPGMEVENACTFRVTRSAELHLEAGGGGDLLEAVEEEVRRRRFRPVVRVEVEDCMPARLRAMLLYELQFEAPEQAGALEDEDVYRVEGLIDLRGLRELAGPGSGVKDARLHYPPEPPREPLDPDRPIFEILREREVLVSFPEDSFEATVERFVLEAADDPDVVAIKLALYRTNRKSRIVEALRRASARGKQVVALVELTARFDEERNVEWARYLRRSGIHVLYGVPGVKIHAKVALVVRRESGAARRYVYVGTGNLNAATATAYTDLGLLSADAALGQEVGELFNALTGASAEAPVLGRLLVAPYNMRRRFLELIEREADHARSGRGGHIVAKFNGLADREMISALYRASRAGVRVELIVRAICSLRPGVAGLSENVRVLSILGRYLEHARIFRFGNAGDPEYFIGSADWRTRNLSRRVEVATPVRDPEHRARLDALLQAQLNDPDAWELGSDGTYYRRPDAAPRDPALPPPDSGRAPIFVPEG